MEFLYLVPQVTSNCTKIPSSGLEKISLVQFYWTSLLKLSLAKKKRRKKIGENSGPLMSLPIDLLNGDRLQHRLSWQLEWKKVSNCLVSNNQYHPLYFWPKKLHTEDLTTQTKIGPTQQIIYYSPVRKLLSVKYLQSLSISYWEEDKI